VAKVTIKTSCAWINAQKKVKVALSQPVKGEAVMIHMNPEVLRSKGCTGSNFGPNCNKGVLAATITGENIIPRGSTHGVDVRNNCNKLVSGAYPNSIQQGTSGGPVLNERGELVGVNSTKSIFPGADGFLGSIGDAVSFLRPAIAGGVPDSRRNTGLTGAPVHAGGTSGG
jgi:hypothetical protein